MSDTIGTATYSPEDNKIRISAYSRLDKPTYERVRAAGFIWAPRQDLFVAPMWTPARADLAEELCGELGDEDASLVDRAEDRAERFEGYGERRAADAESARRAVAAIADNIPLGQPILVGHHSEKHARRDAEKIENGMRKAVKMWETSQYWQDRAAGALRHAKYKERPDVRARRIKGIEADKRRSERAKADALAKLAIWSKDGMTLEQARHVANVAHFYVLRETGQNWSAWDVLRPDEERYKTCPAMTVAQVQAVALDIYPGVVAQNERWIAHFENRLTYERAMLEEQGATTLLEPKPRRELMPLLNYRALGSVITTDNPYNRGSTITYQQIDMTKAEYAKINADYRGVRLGMDKAHRFRTCMRSNKLHCVFLTDSKEHAAPSPSAAPPAAACIEREPIEPRHMAPAAPQASLFDAMKESLRQGVQVVSAPQLFPTPPDVAALMVTLAEIMPGCRVLEPSAGTGQILGTILHGGIAVESVAIELNSACVQMLNAQQAAGAYPGASIRQADFLACNGDLGTFDRILMNPPFANGSDIEHIEHARTMLKPGGRLVAICANGPRQNERLRPLCSEWRDLPAGTFAGTGVHAALLLIEG